MMFYKENDFKETQIGRISKEWKVVKLEDSEVSSHIKSGSTPAKNRADYWNGTIPFVTIGDMTKTVKYLYDTESKITEFALKNSNTLLVPENSILLSMYGTVGKIVINRITTAISQNIAAIIPNRENVDAEFLHYALMHYSFQFKSAKIITLKHLDIQMVKNAKIPLPPVEEQRAIAEVLGVVDSVIAKTGEVIAKTERLKKGLMQTLLTRGIGHKEYKQTPIGTIPKTWQIVPLKTVVKSYKNGIYKPNKYYGRGYPCIRMYNIVEGRINIANATLLDVTEQELEEYGLEPGDVVVNRVNTPELVGKAGVVPDGFGKATFESKNIRIRLNREKLLPQFFSVFVQTTAYAKQVLSRAKIAVAQATITQNDLDSLLIPLPPTIDEQRKIADMVSKIDKKLELERGEKMRLERIKQGLMDLLLTGKIRVKVD